MGDNLIEWDGGKAAAELLPHDLRVQGFRREAFAILQKLEQHYNGRITPNCPAVLEAAKKWGVEFRDAL